MAMTCTPTSATSASASGTTTTASLPFGHELLVNSASDKHPVNLVIHDTVEADPAAARGYLSVVQTRTGKPRGAHSRRDAQARKTSLSHVIRHPTLYRTNQQLFLFENTQNTTLKIPFLHVLSVEITPSSTTQIKTLTIKAIHNPQPQQKGSKFVLWSFQGTVHDSFSDDDHLERGLGTQNPLEAFQNELIKRAYPEGTKRHRRFRVIVNPHGGKAKAKTICHEQVLPVLEAASAHVDVEYTGPPGSPTDATVLGQNHDYRAYDALITVSGDGIPYQILNGLSTRDDARTALESTTLVTVPAGSGNALNINAVGKDHVEDPVWSSLVAIKGRSTKMDLCSFVSGGKRSISFLTQATGLMADIDLGTEHLRWIGDARFTLGYIQGCLQRKKYAFELSFEIAESLDKVDLVQRHNELQAAPSSSSATATATTTTKEEDGGDQGLPPLAYGTDLDPLPAQAQARVHNEIPSATTALGKGWHTIRSDCMWIYGGKWPFISADVKLLSIAEPFSTSGTIDMAIVPPLSALQGLQFMDDASTGGVYWNPELRYYKVKAYRLTMLNPQGSISVDGEKAEYRTFQVECHQGLGRVMTLHGRFEGVEKELSLGKGK
ncbi:BZ3500_MvSof-1268-A1-R1_Chr2-1g04303 [Microbotryum saponariae]|uniref:BZ3500_MvSof-1268-A1-R1_Chr2-1g04303 protein n=1 Tax=Microbotryum saponariae TaxID=289078 RepID=A0A2X0KCE4_9BASI|nr:BZ3500_MvSof-1268-A1-R1_Chr2-1g04303 [Microbotryum saponariae]SCZ91376.1 BZ3501_MvSof-1269-A2-R1_Chr2-1g03959 [Microbotryum saponariae]